MPAPITTADSSPRITVAMSGGVDSSVAALLLMQQGYRIDGLFMKNWQEQDPLQPCTAAQDARDAKSICESLGIDFKGVNFTAEYWQHVFQDFLDEYARGRTPNPDILCNKEIKFKSFLDHARAQGADLIATGHYVRSVERDGRHLLLKGVDPGKDQSYFLYTLGQKELSRVIFPLGDYHKSEIRRLAVEAGLETHDKKDSTGICFIGERDFRAFLRNYFDRQPGDICTPDGQRVGQHDGLMFYTIGQRHGLGIGGQRRTSGKPWYVAAKDMTTNTLTAVQGHDHPALYSTGLTAQQLHWITETPPDLPYRCEVKTRYRQPAQPCRLISLNGDSCRVAFDEPQWAVTPGQAVVFYNGDVCLGGGTIESARILHEGAPSGR